ncbi:spermine oxidase-like [Cydia fagiglandana]|uniref:spermine oxidase-like n=1 Tax=Cydia fagiglandana TaxID=1458189 RepID=UPI002FEE30CD
MLLLIVCVFSLAAGSPVDGPNAYDTIVIGLGSAGATAAAELARSGRKVLALEAQGRVGGRVHTVPFGDGVVELGAEWIHGNVSSRTYALATEHNIDTKVQSLMLDPYRSDGTKPDVALVRELVDLDFTEENPDPPEPLGTFVTKKFMEYITKNKPDLLKDQDFITEYLEFWNLLTNNLESSNDWNDVTTWDVYEQLGGPQAISWHRHGYKTFFEIMLNKYNNGPGLQNLDMKLNTEVTRIITPQHPNETVTVQCKDGASYTARHAIVTVSLGVLKATHTTLFSPPLPPEKQTAIDKVSIGVVGKVILSFEKAWWPKDITLFAFIWKGDDKKKVPAEDYWTTRILGGHPPMGSGNSLTLWTSGEVAKQVERLPEDILKTKCVALLQRFMGDALKITVPAPTGVLRSTWYSNPYTRGSYTYDNLEAPRYPLARKWLSYPLLDSAGEPRVLFAGEATNERHFSTVHGASETGRREAERLLLMIRGEAGNHNVKDF